MHTSQENHVAVIAFVPESRAAMLEKLAGDISVKYERTVTESSLVRELVELAWELFISRSIADQRACNGPEFLATLHTMREQLQ